MLQNRCFFALALRFGFRASISAARSFIMLLCNSVSAGHSGVAASMLLAGVAACLIILSFAAGGRKSYWSAFAPVFPQSWRWSFTLKTDVKNCVEIIFLALVPSCNFCCRCGRKASLCKSLLRVKASLCKSLLRVKASLCKSFSM